MKKSIMMMIINMLEYIKNNNNKDILEVKSDEDIADEDDE